MDVKGFLYCNRLRQVDLARYLGITEAQVSRMCNGSSRVSSTSLSKILNNEFGWDTSCLVDGYPDKQEGVNPKSLVPVLPIAALAGAMSVSESINLYDCEQAVSPVPGASMIVPVYGNSMEPEYPSGSRVVVKKIDESLFIEWGKAFIIDTKNGALLKIVKKADDEGSVLCVSVNEDYDSFVLKKKDILGLYRVLMVMTMK